MAERTVYIKVGAKVEGAVAGLRKVKAGVDDLTKSDLKKPQKAFGDLSNKAALAGGIVALGVGKAIQSFADFDAAMSAVGANTGATGAQFDALREQAIKLGSDTQFSATEAAQGINELAKAGVSTSEIMNGGLKGALDLAAAGQIGVAEAAETTASALNQFGLKGDEAVHVADLLANSANAAQGGVSDMGQALAQAGVAANAAGLNIDETTTLLALFAKAGLIGSDAGTSLKTMMQRLSAPTEKAAETLDDLGISAYDAQGNFVGAESLIKQLSESTKGLSTEAKMAAFNVIFGSDAIRAASIAADAGADGYAKMATEVTKAGGAAENAAKLTDNLKGDIERLGGSIETAFITSGSSANGALRTLTQGIGGLVDKVAAVPGPVLLAGAALGSIALVLPKGLSAYRDFTQSLDTLGISMDKLTAKAPRTARAFGVIGKAAGLLGVAAIGVYAFAKATDKINGDQLGTDLVKTGDGLELINKQLAGQTDNGWGRVGSDIDSFGKILGATFDPGIVNNIDNTIGSLKTVFGGENVSNIQNATKQLDGIDAALAKLATGGSVDKAKAVFAQMTQVAQDQGITVDQLKAKFPQYAAALANVQGDVGRLNGEIGRTSGSAASADGALSDMASGGLADVEDKAKDAKAEMQALLDLIDSTAGGKRAIAADKAALKDSADAAIEAAKDKGGADPDAVAAQKKAKDRLAAAKKGGSKSAITAAQDALTAANKRVAESFVPAEKAQADYEAAMRDTAEQGDRLIGELVKQKKPISEINAAYDTQRAALIKAAEARGFHGEAAEREADKVGITVEQMNELRYQYAHTQEYVDTLVRTPGLPEAKTGVKGYWEVINGVPTFKETKFSAVTGTASQRIADLKAELARIPRNINTLITVRKVQNELKLEANGINGNLATGGPIRGPGSGTSDTAGLYALSNGEHVLTAAEVAAAGGHSAIYALRKAILTGGVQYRASGGPAASYRAAPAARFAGPSIDYDRLAAANARMAAPQLAVYSGQDARSAARTAIRDWEWSQIQ